jgi:hypothetical protein
MCGTHLPLAYPDPVLGNICGKFQNDVTMLHVFFSQRPSTPIDFVPGRYLSCMFGSDLENHWLCLCNNLAQITKATLNWASSGRGQIGYRQRYLAPYI